MKLYELDIDGENSEVYYNSIVNIPAHLKVALKFNTEAAPVRFAFNDEKQIISGVMVAVDEPIYRYNPETKEEFNVVFRKSVADKIIRDYMKKGYGNNLSLDHHEVEYLKSAYLLEMYQIDEARGNSVPKAFEGQNLQDGSIIASYHIEDAQEWEQAKQRGGFSIEGVFDLIEVSTNTKNVKMSLLNKLGFAKPTKNKQKFSETAQAFAEATLEDGTVIYWDGELNEGVEIFVDVDGVMTPAPDGTHVTTEGLVIETAEGVAISISMPETEEVENDFAKATNNRLSEIEQAIEMLKESYDSKFAAQKATIAKQATDFVALESKFEAIKKIAPQPTKEKFAAPKVKAAGTSNFDILAMARNAKN